MTLQQAKINTPWTFNDEEDELKERHYLITIQQRDAAISAARQHLLFSGITLRRTYIRYVEYNICVHVQIKAVYLCSKVQVWAYEQFHASLVIDALSYSYSRRTVHDVTNPTNCSWQVATQATSQLLARHESPSRGLSQRTTVLEPWSINTIIGQWSTMIGSPFCDLVEIFICRFTCAET